MKLVDEPLISNKDSAGLTIKQAEKLNLFFNENINYWFSRTTWKALIQSKAKRY